MSKEKIDILNTCHKKYIAGMESIHTKEFPAVYTDTALDAMDIFGEQQSIEFFKWVDKNYFKGVNGYVPNGWGAYSASYTLKDLYKEFLKSKQKETA